MSNDGLPFIFKFSIYMGVLLFYICFYLIMDRETKTNIGNELKNFWN